MTTTSGLSQSAQPYWIDALIPNFGDNAFRELLGGNTYLFCFPVALPGYDFIPEDGYLYLPFNAEQQMVARQIFNDLSAMLDLQFVETFNPSQPNTIALANNFQESTAGYTYYPSSSFLGSDVFLDRTTSANLVMRQGSSGLLTLVHEIGHAIGLKHPFSFTDAGGDGGEPPYLLAEEDRTQWTVMSYNRSPAQYLPQFRSLDIAALQYLYGPSPTARSGDDSYLVDLFSSSFFWDGGGHDLIDASHLSMPVTLFLEPGQWGYVGTQAASITAAGQATVNYGSVFEDLRGGRGSDRLEGNSVANELRGNGGNDTLCGNGGDDRILGGSGTDTAVFSGVLSSYALVRGTEEFDVADSVAARDGTDTVSDVELLRFSDRSVDLGMAARVQGVDATQLKTLQELYVGFFNRIPEAQGLAYWIDELKGGASLAAIADRFYDAGVQFGLYAANLTASGFIEAVYGNVLGRLPGSPTAPGPQEIAYWEAQLAGRQATRGMMVLQMLDDVHSIFADDPTWGFVADLLDNKAAVAHYHAVELAMGLNNEQANIGFGRDLVALITPTDIAPAIALIGQFDFGHLG